MTLGSVRAQFRQAVAALGFTEHDDGFNFNNIPSTLLDGSFHVELGVITTGPANQAHHTLRYPVTVRVFFKGYRDPNDQIDQALDQAQTILESVLSFDQRLAQDLNRKDIRPLSVSVNPLANSNDNAMILELEFEVYTIYVFNNP
jgi:hypothetical protein